MTRRGVILLALLVAACVTAVAVAPTDALARWMTHPGRSTTSRAADAAWAARAAILIGAPLLGALALVMGRLLRGAAAATPAPAPPSGASLAALAALVVAGTALRIVHLDDSLWYDELAGLLGYSIHGPGVIIGNYFSPANHILSQLLIWGSATALGASEIAVRLPAFLAGILLVPALWALGREARGEGLGVLAALAGAFMPLAITASTDARGYSLVILLSTVATWLLLRALRSTSAGPWCLYAAVQALLVWTHVAAVCVALGHGLVLAALAVRGPWRRVARTGLVALVMAAVGTITLYAPALPDMVSLRSEFRAMDGDEPTLLGPEGWHALLGLGGSWTWWAALPGALLALLGVATASRDPRLGRAVVLAVAGGPVAIVLVVVGDSWLYARFLLFLVPAIALLVAAGLGALARRSRLALIAGTSALVLTATIETLSSPPRQPLREAIELAGKVRGDRPVGVAGLVDQVTLYYSEASRIPTFDLGSLGARIETALPTVKPNAVVLLYPDLVPADRRAFLAAHGYRLHRRLDGWVDWGRGAVEVWVVGGESQR